MQLGTRSAHFGSIGGFYPHLLLGWTTRGRRKRGVVHRQDAVYMYVCIFTIPTIQYTLYIQYICTVHYTLQYCTYSTLYVHYNTVHTVHYTYITILYIQYTIHYNTVHTVHFTLQYQMPTHNMYMNCVRNEAQMVVGCSTMIIILSKTIFRFTRTYFWRSKHVPQ